jgi:5-methylcytosine-specific restriction endonuclease McrA
MLNCLLCKVKIKSNQNLNRHLLLEHHISAKDYFVKYPNAYKYCSKCKDVKQVTNFLSDKSNNYGFRSQCIECMRPDGAKRECPVCNRTFQWSAVISHLLSEHNISTENGYEKYLKEKYCPKCNTVKPLESFSKLKDKSKLYFSYCKDCNLERNFVRTVSDHEYELIHYLITRIVFDDKCFTCELTNDDSVNLLGTSLQIDHIIPHVKGGILSLDNAMLLCRNCNLKKGVKSLKDYLHDEFKNEELIKDKICRLEKIKQKAIKELQRAHNFHLRKKTSLDMLKS